MIHCDFVIIVHHSWSTIFPLHAKFIEILMHLITLTFNWHWQKIKLIFFLARDGHGEGFVHPPSLWHTCKLFTIQHALTNYKKNINALHDLIGKR